jgi:hypothetical protein
MMNNFTCQQILEKPIDSRTKNTTLLIKSPAVALSYDKKSKMLACGYIDGVIAI